MFKKHFWDDLSFLTWPFHDQKMVVCGYIVMDMFSNNTFEQCWIGAKCAKKTSPTPLYHQQSGLLIQGWMDPCFLVVYAKFWPYHLNIGAEIESHPTWQRFSNLLLSNFDEHLQTIASVCCSDRRDTRCVFCCCSMSACRFNFNVLSEMLFCRPCLEQMVRVSVAFLSAQTSHAFLLWPLTSTRYFHP